MKDIANTLSIFDVPLSGMSNVLELLTGNLLKPDLRDGAKFFTQNGNGLLKAIGTRSGALALWSDVSPDVQYLSVQPVKRKTKSEAELQGIWLSQTGDLLFAATSVDIVAINTSSRTMAWDYQQKRQWGFLASIPQGGYLSDEDELTTYYSSGEIVTLDRQSRVLNSESRTYTARMITSVGNHICGSDGHRIWQWSKQGGFGERVEIAYKACYSLAFSGDGSVLAIRSANRVFLHEIATSQIVEEIPCESGLPQMVVNQDASCFGMLNEGRVRFLDRSGELLAVFEIDDEFPVSIHNCGGDVIVGMRSGKVFELKWPV